MAIKLSMFIRIPVAIYMYIKSFVMLISQWYVVNILFHPSIHVDNVDRYIKSGLVKSYFSETPQRQILTPIT